MNYIVYKTTNLINDKFYVGVHNGKSSNYFGSGRLIKAAIKKYGKENFIRETLVDCGDDKEEAYSIEWLLVKTNKEDPRSYNLEPGGLGNSNLGKTVVELGIGIHAASFEDRSAWSKKNQADRNPEERLKMSSDGGKRCIELGKSGFQTCTPEQRMVNSAKAEATKIRTGSYCAFKDPEVQRRNSAKNTKRNTGTKKYNNGVIEFLFRSSDVKNKELTENEFTLFLINNKEFTRGRIFRTRVKSN